MRYHPWWWSSSNDLDRVMIHIHRWCSSDDPDRVMIQIQWWWSRSEDEDELKIKMTWRWRWRELNDDSDDKEKKTCANKLCRENTFLVKRECSCNCNYGMYSLVFLIFHNSMFILGCIVMYLSNGIPWCLFQEVSIMWKSCQAILWVTLLLVKG